VDETFERVSFDSIFERQKLFSGQAIEGTERWFKAGFQVDHVVIFPVWRWLVSRGIFEQRNKVMIFHGH
jgi:hypothetical protein